MQYTSIDIDFFLKRYPIANLKTNSQLKSAKINDILALDCFNEKVNFVPKRAKHNTNTNISTHIRHKDKTLSYRDKLLREVIGNINKINTSNFNNICIKICRIVDINNVYEIVNIILEYACGQHYVYMTQLLDMLNKFPEQFYDIRQQGMFDFGKKSLESFDNTFENLNNLNHEIYDEFCKLLKDKTYLYQRWILLYNLFDTNQVNLEPEVVFEKLKNNLIIYQKNKILQTHILDMILVFFQKFKRDHMHLYLTFLEIIDTLDPMTTKGNFICKDIMVLK